jgi:hypothetical protein
VKVLKTELSKQVLADPKAANQLRRFMVARSSPTGEFILVRAQDGTVRRLKPEVVPKAA